MAGLTIHSEKLTPALAKELSALCPFGALEETAEGLAVGAGCKMGRLCIKKAAASSQRRKPKNRRFALGWLHPVTLELLGKAL